MRRLLFGLTLAPVLLFAAACGGAGPRTAAGDGDPVSGAVIVFAAASLTDVFNELATEFERKYPGVEVRFNFAGSPTLRSQLELGARAEAFASADGEQMRLAASHGVVSREDVVFARNSLVVITPRSNPGRISTLADLQRGGLKLVLANPDVPAGQYSREVLDTLSDSAGYGEGFAGAVLKNVVSNESNVKQVVAKVELGEADAGIVYATDVTPSLAARLTRVDFPPRFRGIAEYPIALTRDARNPRAAQAFIDFLLSAEGQAVLARWGFMGAE